MTTIQKTAFIDIVVDGEKYNAHNVVLCSEDGTFGIKDISTGSVIVSANASVSNPSTGRYEYSFEADPDKSYYVVWKVELESGEEPSYTLQVLDVSSTPEPEAVTAVTDYRGTFHQGTSPTFIVKITKFDGDAVDAETITYQIIDSAGDEVVTGTPEKVTTGSYVFQWAIEDDQDPAKYKLIWRYTIDDFIRREEFDIVVAPLIEGAGDSALYNGLILFFRQAVEIHIEFAQSMPVYRQQAQPSRDFRTYRWTKGRWNQTLGTRIYRNNKQITEGFEIDYFKGLIKFSNPLTAYDTVEADYNFRWFSDDHLDRYISNGFHILNMYPPHSSYSVGSVPEKYMVIVIYLAAIDALRNLLLAINFEEPIQFLGGPEQASKKAQQLEALKKNYEEMVYKLLEQKKYFPYKGLTKAIVVPEFTLPGGRSRWFRMLFKGGT